MLDAETKRKIDSARDILVGKVPDPKAQVEQITTALIYKFMDDMDREAEELGGKATFLTGELETYQWANLMSKELGGEARLNLYMSALLAFSKTPTIPEIFRTIFKDAFLPYRDPETLNLFLKQIDWFDYDHSENLGDAFEYLLSVLGSQGDAGQFRTPRHIIDFMVEVIEPKKTDTILDPSCGTAGFLISAYKHILANNATLTPSEKKQLVQHFTGYDISPDMVRLSLVNLYLHSFPTPKVYEYDTLTSEDRWQENFDVILANPPFMTPKGGIRPHNRFSVQAKRSEVLFVDYIAEHLNLNGRAGIIVPEGIIFQSANAYKALRKMLVDNHFLWAVVSLPAGVFQPYSGVKTSILLLDRGIAKQRDDVLFIKLASDGYDLGAQRRENTTSDLPTALDILKAHRRGEAVDNPFAQVVAKAKIAKNGDYNLTGDRYRETKARENLVYPLVKLGDICEVINGRAYKQDELLEKGKYLVLRVGNFFTNKSFYYSDLELPEDKYCHTGDLLYAWSASFGVKIWDGEKAIYHYHIWKMLPNENVIEKKFLYSMLEYDTENLKKEITNGNTMLHLTKEGIEKRLIPLPPLEIQNAIVAEIEQWQKVIDGAKQVVDNYTVFISDNDLKNSELVSLDNILEFKNGLNYTKESNGETIKVLGVKDFKDNLYAPMDDFEQITIDGILSESYLLNENDIIFVRSNGNQKLIGRSLIIPKINTKVSFSGFTIRGRFKIKDINPLFFALFFKTSEFHNELIESGEGANIKSLNQETLKNIKVPLPPLEIQNAIVEKIEKERAAVESCKTLIALFETKIKNKIAQVWGE